MEVRIGPLVQEVEKIANETFLKNIKVITHIAPELWTVAGDPTQLHQVLLNLCVNARDAMPGGGDLTIGAENVNVGIGDGNSSIEAKPGPHVCLSVEDSGTGMPPEVVEHMFDPFFTTKEHGSGTGLGLSTSLAIIRSHGGFVHVYSEPGEGTVFKIYLPAGTGMSAGPAEELAGELPRGRGELILVVDDEEAVREITRRTLESFGYRVLLAANGVEGVAAFAEHHAGIAAVLTDMMMPEMDGPKSIPLLREIDPGVRIIAASGLSAKEHVARANDLGVRHFLPKPYTAEVLLRMLRQALDAS